MKYKCRHCDYVGPPGYPSPIGSVKGDEAQPAPACPKCFKANMILIE